MDIRIQRIGDSALLFVAVVLGTVLAPAMMLVGVPTAAAGIAGLTYRGHTGLAAFAAAVGVSVVGVLSLPYFRILSLPYVAFVAPAMAAVVLTVILLPKRPFQAVVGGLIGVLTLASIASDELVARLSGNSLESQIAATSQAAASEMIKMLGTSAPDTIRGLQDAARTVASAWPSAYFQTAVLVSVLTIVAIAWAARRVGFDLAIPSLSRLDLTPHILWAFVLGLFMLAFAYASFAGSVVLGVVGLNLVLCVRTLLLLQGIGVVAGVLDRAGVGLGGRILAVAALAALDVLTLVVSFTGLLDFWINFRRLPREGAAPAVAEPDGRRW